jgi:hypothetical protein
VGRRGFQSAKSGTPKDRALENLAARRDLKEERKEKGWRPVTPAARWDEAENCFLAASYRRGEALPQAAMNAPRLNCVKGHEDVTMNWTPSDQDPHITC